MICANEAFKDVLNDSKSDNCYRIALIKKSFCGCIFFNPSKQYHLLLIQKYPRILCFLNLNVQEIVPDGH